MQTDQNPGSTGLPRSDVADAKGSSSLLGVQTTGEETRPPAVTHADKTSADGLCQSNSNLGGTIQTIADGFASPTWKPHGYQDRGIEWLTHRIEGALFLAPGMGKTSVVLAAFQKLQQEGLVKRMLVLAPLTVCVTTWYAEPKKWRQFQTLKIGLAHGPDKKAVLCDPTLDIVVMNYDGLAWAAPLLQQRHHFEVIVYDELTKLKHTKSKRFKLIKPLLRTFKFKWGLTGTPTANGLIDLFGQVYVLDEGHRLGRYITHFRAAYFYQEAWDQFRYYITPEATQRLTSKLTDLAMYMDPKDYLELPGLFDVVRPVKLHNMTEYKVLRDEFIVKMQDTTITAVNAGVLTSKLRQFAGGALYLEDKTRKEVGSDKIEALQELIEELNGEPLIIAYEFNHEVERLLKVFPDAKAIRGGMGITETKSIVSEWNTGALNKLLIQPQAGAHGLNLQGGGCAICWFSLTYNLENYIQLIARIYRQGQTSIVRNYLLVAEGTIDEYLVKVLSAKNATQEGVFQALKAYALEK